MLQKTQLFRRLRVKDAEAMHELESICFSLPWSLEQCVRALMQRNFAAFGLWQDELLLAYISFFRSPEEIEILNLAVHPRGRRRGYASHMLHLLLQAGRKMGMQKAVLEVREKNIAAIALYEKAGFYMAGLRKRYYSDTGENAMIYNCDL